MAQQNNPEALALAHAEREVSERLTGLTTALREWTVVASRFALHVHPSDPPARRAFERKLRRSQQRQIIERIAPYVNDSSPATPARPIHRPPVRLGPVCSR